MPAQHLYIELGTDSSFTLVFEILNTALADLWIERMNVREQYPLDHPKRFYGFNSRNKEIEIAEQHIRSCIKTINGYHPIIEQEFTNVYDQDCLNYMHHIFEVYHGLLDQQNHEFWLAAPVTVKRALAELNIAVHRCETASRTSLPRLVCTWFGLPKTEILLESTIKAYGVLNPGFGTVCLNYVEIGKTLEDLAIDNDNYIADDAFKPFNSYSADFVIRFSEQTPEEINTNLTRMQEYHQQHYDFFNTRSLSTFDDVRLLPLRYPVAKLIETCSRDHLLKEIQLRQHVNRVYIQ